MEPGVLGEPEWRSNSNEDMDISDIKVKDEEADSDKEMSKECLDPSRFVMANMEWTQVDYEGPREAAKLMKNCSEGNGNPVMGVNTDDRQDVSDRNVNKDMIKDEEEDSDIKDTCFDPSKFVKTEIEWPQTSDEGPAQPQLKAIN